MFPLLTIVSSAYLLFRIMMGVDAPINDIGLAIPLGPCGNQHLSDENMQEENILLNRLCGFNNQKEIDWINNLSYNSFKIKCKCLS